MACKTVENYEEGTYFIKPLSFILEEPQTATNLYHNVFRCKYVPHRLDIFNKSGVQTPIKARVAERLGQARCFAGHTQSPATR